MSILLQNVTFYNSILQQRGINGYSLLLGQFMMQAMTSTGR